jgi:uncharacterized protein (TIGR03000 family)
MPAVQPPPPPAAGAQATLKVAVPEDALVYVNGMLTKSKGAERSYLSRGLLSGYQYNYEVRAEAIRDGQKIEETKVIQLKAGDTVELAFENLARSSETTLTLHVPSDAKVTLGGNPTRSDGPVRVFTTKRLSGDTEWTNYVVQVSVERDGRTVTQEKSISLKAGDSQSLDFDFDAARVAAR